jgi:hypothetical protein
MFNKYGKKVLSLAMATAMAASMALPTFAANSTVVTAAYQEIEIAVTVPDTGTAIINPYGLPVDVQKSDKTKVQISGEPITTQPLYIANNGTIALKAGAKVTVTNGKSSGIKFVSALNTTANTDKEIKLSLDMVSSTVTGKPSETKVVSDAVIDEFVKSTTWSSPATAAITTDTSGVISGAMGDDDVVTLKALDADGSYQKNSLALVRLSGEVNKAAEWSTKDTFNATIAFTFTPDTN